MTKEYVRGKRLCEACRAKALVRQMTAEADHEKQKEIFKILHDAEKRFEDIKRLWRKDAILRYVTCNTLEIQVGTERWRIERLGKEDFRLLHNSYLIVNYQRYSFTKSFHEQPLRGMPTFYKEFGSTTIHISTVRGCSHRRPSSGKTSAPGSFWNSRVDAPAIL